MAWPLEGAKEAKSEQESESPRPLSNAPRLVSCLFRCSECGVLDAKTDDLLSTFTQQHRLEWSVEPTTTLPSTCTKLPGICARGKHGRF